jgi:hypothetical protein
MDQTPNLEESGDLSTAQPVVTICFDFHYQRSSVYIHARQAVGWAASPSHAACSLDRTEEPAIISDGGPYQGG